jgi:hypothetical protein
LKKLWVIIFNFLLLGLPILVWAGEGLDVPEGMDKKIDLAHLTGLNYFFASWYNDNMWLYALMVTAIMGVVGLLIALVTDIILKMIGMEVHKMEHHE